MTNVNEAQTLSNLNESWVKLSAFMKPSGVKATWQLVTTVGPYIGLWALMVYLLNSGYSYFMVLGIAIITGGFMVRIFILFHDCCHGSFFKSRKVNQIVGYITGVLTFTPFEEWRRLHNVHHATSGDLDRRGVGDIWTMTVEEYKNSSRLKRLGYRLFRNPLVMFGLGPIFLFLITMRFPHKDSKGAERRSVIVTNLLLLVKIVLGVYLLGLETYLLIQGPILIVGGMIGIWLFYVQHQYEDVYWTRNQSWDMTAAALNGSSYYKLPAVLHWLTGNIGYHHIHHLRPRIPNYNLPSCNRSIDELNQVEPLTIRKSLRSLWLNLWDEENKQLVSFKAVKSG